VSINHAYEDGKFYFHCAVGGKKVDSIERNLSVVYTIIKYYGTPENFKNRNDCPEGNGGDTD
jgi:nitroimidazol reductase NimA-like FMN-containing flavoprotein (pyridoxamine 5'-phosphate oxidase superfamily)